MDVRCESCHTEYELDDGSVSESGTDVQCTFCGHTFTVFRRESAVPAAAAGATGSGEFSLETADGRVHRLRDLTILQKWIIERRVTRSDRLSRGGQEWSRLGAMEDLAPFFDVVDEADRARAAVARPSTPEIAAVRARAAAAPGAPVAAGGTVLGHSSPSLPVMPVVTPRGGEKPVGDGTRPRGGERATNRSLELMAVEAPLGGDHETALIRRPTRGWWKLLVTFGVAGGVAYGGIRALPGMMSPAPADPASANAVPAGTEPTGHLPTVTPIEPTPRQEPAAAEAVAPGAVPLPAAPAAATAPPTPPATPPPPVEAPAPPPPTAARPPEKPATRRAPAAAEPVTYEALVAQADRLLGNGANERAQRLYERALALKPGAPDALTGIGYAHLDRSRTGPAIDYFTRASSGAPFPAALFGLGQAYRAAGDFTRARDTYRRYISLFPGGPEASAAERQLRSMPAAGETGEVSAPASILQEGGQEAGKAREGGGGNTPANPPRPFDSPSTP